MAKVTFPKATKQRMEILMKSVDRASELKRVQCILLGACGISSPQIAPLVGLNSVNIRKIWNRYKKEGESAIIGERRGSRGKAHLSLEEEKLFLKPFLKKGTTGQILIVSNIHKAHEQKIGKHLHHSVTYRLLARHGWRKIAPRPYHPKRDKEQQEAFKAFFPHKNHPGSSEV